MAIPKQGSTNSRYHPYGRAKKTSMTTESSHRDGSVVSTHVSRRVIGDHLSVNELKRRIRDVKRLLNHADLPGDARIIQERALAGYEKDLAAEVEKRKRSEMIKKYHFVRFLGRSIYSHSFLRDMEANRGAFADYHITLFFFSSSFFLLPIVQTFFSNTQ
jgi:rRNA-processing protein Efg1